ncbi:EamA family transporter [Flavobacterium columnare]|uniref:Permease YojE n=1 Tax=Flavobacterium columnare (strain ATCC 49512 / CIP 103533 / TG 44/87) TaxID=1041826 RepID=G8X627_FLACA|nr:EamA family transporter [Flavobacterium columnare]AEW86257.1 permease YojE [Flavobacterium columnare ATCC 49512]ANO48539.1 permease YojE [Flavobacterium columnare]APT23410.1 EamA family transporter [Flavobacterium columnare]PDS23386.1 EamA family transporter [Flavobacterium columnare] [Flavobacterium columnare NBRC 100251 = ATCC 23463]
MNLNKYFVAAFSSFFIWGFFSLAIKKLHAYPSLDILFYRVFYATFLLLLINLLFRKHVVFNNFKTFNELSIKIKKKTIFLTVLGGFLLVLNWFLFMYCVNHVSIQSASFAYLICPIITTILAYFILKENLNKGQWIAVGLFIISCGILSYGHIEDLIYSLIIASTFAMYLISQRKNNQFDRFVVLTIQLMISSLLLLPFYFFYKSETPIVLLFWEVMTFIVVLFTILPLFLNLYALKGIDSKTVGVLMYTNPLINFFLALFYFKEEINLIQLSAYLLIIVAIILFNINYFVKKGD